jgi:hypothetical protein
METIMWGEDDKEGGMIMASQFGYPKTQSIVAGSSSKHELRVYERNSGEICSTVSGFNGPVVALHMDHQGKTVAMGTKSGGVVLLHYGGSDQE